MKDDRFTPEQIEQGNVRLLLAAQATLESKVPASFRMNAYAHDCKTPACVLGNYAIRDDLQDVFELHEYTRWDGRKLVGLVPKGNPGFIESGHNTMDCDGTMVQEHFAIGDGVASNIFGVCGCDDADTPQEAAAYIEKFVADRRAAVAPPVPQATESDLEQAAQVPSAPSEDQSTL